MFKSINSRRSAPISLVNKALESAGVFVGTGSDPGVKESMENFQLVPSATYNGVLGSVVDAFGNSIWLGPAMIRGGLDYDFSVHDFQDEANGNYATLTGGIGWLGDAHIITPT